MRKNKIPIGRKGCALAIIFPNRRVRSPEPTRSATSRSSRCECPTSGSIMPFSIIRPTEPWIVRPAMPRRETLRDSTDVLVPGIALCVRCHGPSAGRGDIAPGGGCRRFVHRAPPFPQRRPPARRNRAHRLVACKRVNVVHSNNSSRGRCNGRLPEVAFEIAGTEGFVQCV